MIIGGELRWTDNGDFRSSLFQGYVFIGSVNWVPLTRSWNVRLYQQFLWPEAAPLCITREEAKAMLEAVAALEGII